MLHTNVCLCDPSTTTIDLLMQILAATYPGCFINVEGFIVDIVTAWCVSYAHLRVPYARLRVPYALVIYTNGRDKMLICHEGICSVICIVTCLPLVLFG